jgi:hypothetical protein
MHVQILTKIYFKFGLAAVQRYEEQLYLVAAQLNGR